MIVVMMTACRWSWWWYDNWGIYDDGSGGGDGDNDNVKDDLVTLTVVFLISLPMMMMVAVMVMTYCWICGFDDLLQTLIIYSLNFFSFTVVARRHSPRVFWGWSSGIGPNEKYSYNY